MPPILSSRDRARLKARAHGLDPLVQVGHAGVTGAVLAEVNRALDAHELIKVKLAGADRETRETWTGTLCAGTDAAAVQQVGKVLVLWRPRPEDATPADAPTRSR